MAWLGMAAVGALTAAVVFTRQQSVGDATLQERVLAVAAQLRAPGDRNTMTVATSSLPAGQHMRYDIQQELLQGDSQRQIIDNMVSLYGQDVLAAPPMQGFGRLVWVVPWAALGALVVGLVLLFRRNRRWQQTDGTHAVDLPASADDVNSDEGNIDEFNTDESNFNESNFSESNFSESNFNEQVWERLREYF